METVYVKRQLIEFVNNCRKDLKKHHRVKALTYLTDVKSPLKIHLMIFEKIFFSLRLVIELDTYMLYVYSQ